MNRADLEGALRGPRVPESLRDWLSSHAGKIREEYLLRLSAGTSMTAEEYLELRGNPPEAAVALILLEPEALRGVFDAVFEGTADSDVEKIRGDLGLLRAVVLPVVLHRWLGPPPAKGIYPVLRCARCGAEAVGIPGETYSAGVLCRSGKMGCGGGRITGVCHPTGELLTEDLMHELVQPRVRCEDSTGCRQPDVCLGSGCCLRNETPF